jgi:DNA-binding response OmpR family regulator
MPQHERDRIVVVSRDPRLADVRKRVLENAGFAVIAASDASIVEQACGHQRVRLIMLGHSLSPADKRHVWAAAKAALQGSHLGATPGKRAGAAGAKRDWP